MSAEQVRSERRTMRRVVAALALVVLTFAAGGVLPSAADHGGPHLDQLARSTFTDDVAAQIRLKLDGRRTNVVNVHDASDIVFAEITAPDGAAFPWHTHPGPVLVANQGPGTFTFVNADDCVLREYPPGTAFVDPGQGNLHTGFNHSGQDLTMYAVFLDVQDGLLIPADPPPDCDPLP